MVQAMDGLNDGFPETALARLFVGEQRSDEVIYFSLPGGRALFLAGEQTEMLYFVRTGRLGVVRREEGQDQQFLGIIKPGEPAGEMSLVAGVVHSATVIALRDSEILALPRAAFFTEARRRPDLMAELARLMILRVRETGARTSAGDPIVFGFVGVAKGVQVRRLVDQVERCIVSQGFTVTVVGAEATAAPTEWFSTVEQRHDHVLYVAEADETAWAEQCGRQVDRLFLVGAGDAPPPARPSAFAAEAMRQHRLMDLVLMHEPGVKQPSGSEAWLDAAGAARLFHLRRDDAADTARLARVLTRTSVGLVLSGGGARAYAHLGAIRALREAGSPIDFIGGTSMGGMIGAGVAAGWDDAEMDRRIRHAFVDSSPLGDIAFPIIAMTGGKTAARRILENFDEIQIADLWLPFFCVSSNLTTGHHQVHKRGGLSRALQASSALPGVLPPVVDGDAVLVDGAVLRNFPSDVMRAWHRGPVVGVDVTRSRGLTAKDVAPPASIFHWILSGDFLKGPPIVSLLIRAATVSTNREQQAARDATDLLILPKVEDIELRDWKAFEPAVQAGYDAAVLALKDIGPVTEIRRRKLAAAPVPVPVPVST
jgi:NTE family protein